MKFQVGDRVRSKNTGYRCLKEMMLGIVCGDVVWGMSSLYSIKILEGVPSDGDFNWLETYFLGKKRNFHERELELIERANPRVRIVGAISGCKGAEGKTGIITKEKSTDGLIGGSNNVNVLLDNGEIWEVNKSSIKMEGQMSRYEELKAQIEGLNNGWTKEADDVLNEIADSRLNKEYILFIPLASAGIIHIHDAIERNHFQGSSWEGFPFSSQCSKNRAFKDALLWLLEHSDLKKDLVGQEVKAEIEGKIYKVKVISNA